MPNQIGLDAARHRNLEGREKQPWFRRTALALLTLLPVLALLNVFGQQPSTSSAQGTAAGLRVSAPETVRGGLLFQARFDIDAHRPIKKPVLHLAGGWLENLTLNTLEPSPTDEAWTRGGLELTFLPVPAGGRLTVFIQYQVNPTAFGRQSQSVALMDGKTMLGNVYRTLTVLP